MSTDHKPNNPEETERVKKANGFVRDNRILGILNLSRSIGDLDYKTDERFAPEAQLVVADPEIKTEPLGKKDFLIIACDGIWDCLSNQECVDYIVERLPKGEKLSKISEELFASIKAPDEQTSSKKGGDNMTCIIVEFKK